MSLRAFRRPTREKRTRREKLLASRAIGAIEIKERPRERRRDRVEQTTRRSVLRVDAHPPLARGRRPTPLPRVDVPDKAVRVPEADLASGDVGEVEELGVQRAADHQPKLNAAVGRVNLDIAVMAGTVLAN